MRYLFSVLLIFHSIVFSYAQYNLAIVDADYVIKNMPDYQIIKEKLESYQKKLLIDLEVKKKDIAKFYVKNSEEIKKGLLTPKEKELKEQELQLMQEGLDSLRISIDRKLMSRENLLTEPIYIKFRAILKSFALKNNYDLILDKRYAHYVGSKVNATDRVLKMACK